MMSMSHSAQEGPTVTNNTFVALFIVAVVGFWIESLILMTVSNVTN